MVPEANYSWASLDLLRRRFVTNLQYFLYLFNKNNKNFDEKTIKNFNRREILQF